MPTNGSGVYSLPSGTEAVFEGDIVSADINSRFNDLAAAQNAARPIVAGGTGAATTSSARDNLGVSGKVLSKSSDYTLVAADRDKQVIGTAALVLSLPAAATAGDGFIFHAKADGGEMTVDPNGSETVDGAATFAVADGAAATFRCDGSGWHSAAGAGGGSVDLSSVAEDIVPDADGTRDLGSSDKCFAETHSDKLFTPLIAASGGDTAFSVHGIAKAHASIDQTGAQSIRTGSVNISSIVDTGVGMTTLNFTAAFASANQTIAGSVADDTTYPSFTNDGKATGSVGLRTLPDQSSSFTDSESLDAAVWGDLA